MEWIDPRYADLVACYRQQDFEAFGPLLERPDGEPVPPRLGFVMEPLRDE